MFLIKCQELEDKLHTDTMYIQVFCEDFLAGSKTDPSHVNNLMDCLDLVLTDEFIHFFFTFSNVLPVIGNPDHLSSCTDSAMLETHVTVRNLCLI